MHARNETLEQAEKGLAADGECLLTGMRGETLERLGPPAAR